MAKIPPKAEHQPDVDECCQFEPRFRPGTKVPLPYREFMATTSTADTARYSGIGLTLDEVIAAQHEVARDLWETLEEEHSWSADNRVATAEEFMADMGDVAIWEGGKLRAALRLTLAARPDFEVTRFDRLEETWRHFKVMTPRAGDTVLIVEGFGVTLADAVRAAEKEIVGELRFMDPPDDRLILESGVIVKVVRAGVLTGSEPAGDDDPDYVPADDDDWDAMDDRVLDAIDHARRRRGEPPLACAGVRGDDQDMDDDDDDDDDDRGTGDEREGDDEGEGDAPKGGAL